jgi:hypothetical protein
VRSANDLLDEKINSQLPVITESGELLSVGCQLMTYLMKKRKPQLPAITESGELVR